MKSEKKPPRLHDRPPKRLSLIDSTFTWQLSQRPQYDINRERAELWTGWRDWLEPQVVALVNSGPGNVAGVWTFISFVALPSNRVVLKAPGPANDAFQMLLVLG